MGEGTIFITPTKQAPYKGKIYFGLLPTIGICNTDRAIMDFCKNFLSNFYAHETECRPSKNGKKKSWYLRVNRQRQILKVLDLIRPFLIGDKAKAADLMIEFCSSRSESKRDYAGRDLEIYRQIRDLNGRGKRGNKIYREFMKFVKRRQPRINYKGKNNPMFGKFGKKNPMFGKHHSEETKRKIREALKIHVRRS